MKPYHITAGKGGYFRKRIQKKYTACIPHIVCSDWFLISCWIVIKQPNIKAKYEKTNIMISSNCWGYFFCPLGGLLQVIAKNYDQKLEKFYRGFKGTHH